MGKNSINKVLGGKRKLLIFLIIILAVIVTFLFIRYQECDSIQLNANKDCYCPQDAKKESYPVVCIVPPCPTETYYRCRYSECEINADCPKGQVCGGDGKIGKFRPIWYPWWIYGHGSQNRLNHKQNFLRRLGLWQFRSRLTFSMKA